MEARIRTDLEALEREEGVAILLAVESGSRAWGFPSVDSDYDVRFIYVHRPEWYLSIADRRDVIERPIRDALDFSGWEIRKALRLFRKSNPPLIEWLQCPMVYRERFSFSSRLRALLPAFYSPQASFHHYLHMAQGNYREYLRGERVWRKKYFYVLRPIFSMRWIEKGLGPVPIEFSRLVEAVVPEPEVRREVDQLLEQKRAGAELDEGPWIPVLSDLIDRELARLEKVTEGRRSPAPDEEPLNILFRETLAEAWGGL